MKIDIDMKKYNEYTMRSHLRYDRFSKEHSVKIDIDMKKKEGQYQCCVDAHIYTIANVSKGVNRQAGIVTRCLSSMYVKGMVD